MTVENYENTDGHCCFTLLPEGVMTLREELTGSIDFIQFYADSYGGFARNGDTVDICRQR